MFGKNEGKKGPRADAALPSAFGFLLLSHGTEPPPKTQVKHRPGPGMRYASTSSQFVAHCIPALGDWRHSRLHYDGKLGLDVVFAEMVLGGPPVDMAVASVGTNLPPATGTT